jgi:hypothetical protein
MKQIEKSLLIKKGRQLNANVLYNVGAIPMIGKLATFPTGLSGRST